MQLAVSEIAILYLLRYEVLEAGGEILGTT